MFCKGAGTYNLNVVLPNDEHLDGDLVSWMNGLVLTYKQRSDMRDGFFAQQITDLTSLRRVDVAAIMLALTSSDHTLGFDVEIEQRLLDEIEQRLLDLSGHEVTIVVTNKGGPIKSWLLPVSKNCNRVSHHLLQVTHLAVTELVSRGFEPPDFESSNPLATDRLRNMSASWTRNGVVVMPSTLGEMFCKGAGTYNLNVVLPNDEHLEGDLVSWMNGLVLTYKQRSDMRQGFFAQQITDLTSLRRVDVAALKLALTSPSNTPGFDVEIEQRLLDQKQFLIRALSQSATPGATSMLQAPHALDEKMLEAQHALDEKRFEVQR